MMKIIVAISVGIVNIIWKNFVFMNLWNWFITRLGVTKISLTVSSGVLLVYGCLTYKYTEIDDVTMKKILTASISNFIGFSLILLLGFIIKSLN